MSRRGEDRRQDYKNQGLTNVELRRRREETTVELRRTKREDSLREKRRNVASLTDSPIFAEERSDSQLKELSIGQQYVKPLLSNDFNAIYEACHALRKIVSKEQNPPIQDIIELDIVGRLVELLSTTAIPPGCPPELADKIVFESAWVLTNIASGASLHTMAVVKAGAVPIFIQLLSSPNRDIKEQSVWALGNIAGDCPQLRDFVLRSDAMVNLLQIIYEEASKPSPYLPLLRNSVWTVSNMCRGKPAPSWNQIVIALNVLTEMLSSNDDEILIDSCWAFSYITDGADQNLLEVIRITGDDSVTQHVVDIGVLGSLKALLSSPKQAIQKEACWAVSNVTAGTLPQIRAVYENQIFPILIHILANAEPKTKREACWALCNATSCYETAQDIIRYLVSERIIPPLCSMLKSGDSKILQVTMDGIENILQVGEQDAVHREDGINQYAAELEDAGGMDDLYELQSHFDSNVYLKSKTIIEKFFREDEEINLEINDGPQTFSF